MSKPIILPKDKTYVLLRDNMPKPFSLKLSQIASKDDPEAIYGSIIDLFEQFYMFMVLIMVSQYFFDRIDKEKKQDREFNDRLIKFNDHLRERIESKKLLFSQKSILFFDLLRLYQDRENYLVIENMFSRLCKSNEKSEFVLTLAEEIKQIHALKDSMIGLNIGIKPTIEDFSKIMVMLRNRWAHGHSPKGEEREKLILPLWRAVLNYFSAMDFILSFKLGFLSEKHEDVVKRLDFEMLEGPSVLETDHYFTRNQAEFNELENKQVYLGKREELSGPDGMTFEQFRPRMSLHPLVIFSECKAEECTGRTIFFMDSMNRDSVTYRGAVCGHLLKPDDLKLRGQEYFEFLFTNKPVSDARTFRGFCFRKEKNLQMYRDMVLMSWEDGFLDEKERRSLEDYRKKLGLTLKDARRIESNVQSLAEVKQNIREHLSHEAKSKVSHFKEIFRMAWMDGILSDEEREEIDAQRKALHISEKKAQSIEQEVISEPRVAERIRRHRNILELGKSEMYSRMVKLALSDFVMLPSQRKELDRLKEEIGLSAEEAEKIEKAVKQELGIADHHKKEDSHQVADELLNEAMGHIGHHKFEDAIMALGRARAHAPQNHVIYRNMGYVMMCQKRFRDAVGFLLKSFTLHDEKKGKDKNYLTNLYLSRCLYKLDRINAAKLFARNCIRLEPKRQEGYLTLAHIYSDYLDRKEDAVQVLKSGIQAMELGMESGKALTNQLKMISGNSMEFPSVNDE